MLDEPLHRRTLMPRFTLHHGDCIEVMRTMPDASVDAIVTDPPYLISFMGKEWDSEEGIAGQPEVWREALRVLKPGGHLLSFAGSRTYHRIAAAIEDAGFEIRDQLMWIYGSGFPKSLDVSKAIDKAAGAEREVVGLHGAPAKSIYSQGANELPKDVPITAPATPEAQQWAGWGTALKPAHEPIVLARKPLIGTVAANVLAYGTGALNIDGCRVSMGDEYDPTKIQRQQNSDGAIDGAFGAAALIGKEIQTYKPGGRWPANVIHDGSDEVVALFPDSKGMQRGTLRRGATTGRSIGGDDTYGIAAPFDSEQGYGDSGSAARFFYCAKANKRDRNEGCENFDTKQTTGGGGLTAAGSAYGSIKAPAKNHHPTVKPCDLMRYLARLICPPGGVILDPFTGSGSTGKAAMLEGFDFIGIEQDADYVEIARARISYVLKHPEQVMFPRDEQPRDEATALSLFDEDSA